MTKLAAHGHDSRNQNHEQATVEYRLDVKRRGFIRSGAASGTFAAALEV